MFYRLVKVEMWKNRINTSGFKVTYERPDEEQFDLEGWPLQLEHMFGFEDQYFEQESIVLTQDLDSLTICTDYLNSDKHADFEGLEFYEYGVDEAVKLTPNCPKNTH